MPHARVGVVASAHNHLTVSKMPKQAITQNSTRAMLSMLDLQECCRVPARLGASPGEKHSLRKNYRRSKSLEPEKKAQA